jgi:N-acetyl-anhydromuramyl-L-alanine amidase AmpD
MIRGDNMKINEVNYKWNGNLTKRTKTEMIVLHHADAKNCTAQDIHSWHLDRGWTGIGYNFFVRKDGQIYRGRPEDVVGAHATNYNSKSIGICFEGNYTTENMPKAQLEAGKELVAYLKDKYKITKVKGHRDLMATDCPGENFPFDEIAKASKISNSNTSTENLILSFQKAAMADDKTLFPKYGADGRYGNETAVAMQKCVVKRRVIHQYKNCTKLVQRLLGFIGSDIDGKCGPKTSEAIKKFQKENGLVSDGSCGFNTWKVLLGIK